MTLEVRVEEKHIVGAVAKSATACPIARALRDQYGGEWSIKTLGDWNVACQWVGKRYHLPSRAVHFCRDFDEGRPVYPNLFVLELTLEGT
jgi:hypothetical protein